MEDTSRENIFDRIDLLGVVCLLFPVTRIVRSSVTPLGALGLIDLQPRFRAGRASGPPDTPVFSISRNAQNSSKPEKSKSPNVLRTRGSPKAFVTDEGSRIVLGICMVKC